MQLFDEVMFLNIEWTIVDIDTEVNMYKVVGNGYMTWLKESDLKPIGK